MSDDPYQIVMSGPAERGLSRLPESVAAAVIEFVVGPLSDNPRRVGHALREEMTGLWSARRGPYRVVYKIEEERRRVVVARIEHRSDVYRPR